MKIAVMAGSFDPVTYGHTWVMERALDVADKLIIIVGRNPAKKYMFNEDERKALTADALCDVLPGNDHNRFEIVTIGNQLVIDYARDIGAKLLVRGIRNSDDFRVEHEMNMIHQRMYPTMQTAYFIPPRELAEVSSSVVKSLVGFDRWERAAAEYVSTGVLLALMHKHEQRMEGAK